MGIVVSSLFLKPLHLRLVLRWLFYIFGRPGDVDGLTGSDHLVQHVVIVTPASGRSPEHSLSTVAEAAYSALSVSSTPLKVSKPSAKQSTSRPATSTTSQEALSQDHCISSAEPSSLVDRINEMEE